MILEHHSLACSMLLQRWRLALQSGAAVWRAERCSLACVYSSLSGSALQRLISLDNIHISAKLISLHIHTHPSMLLHVKSLCPPELPRGSSVVLSGVARQAQTICMTRAEAALVFLLRGAALFSLDAPSRCAGTVVLGAWMAWTPRPAPLEGLSCPSR